MVTGSRLGVLVDSSDASCSEERLPDLQRHLLVNFCCILFFRIKTEAFYFLRSELYDLF